MCASLFKDINLDSKSGHYRKSRDLANSEYRPKKSLVTKKSGEVVNHELTAIDKRIVQGCIAKIQQQLIHLDREKIKDDMEEELKQELSDKNITSISPEIYHYAIEEKIRKKLKDTIDTEFRFKKEELLDITNLGETNIHYLNKKLEELQVKDTYKIKEIIPDETFEDIKTRVLSLVLIPTFTIESKNEKESDEIIISLNKDAIPYVVAQTKNFIQVPFSEVWDYKNTDIMYELGIECFSLTNLKFTFKELQERFGTKYGIEKKPNPKYDPETMPKNEMYLKNRLGDDIFLVDKDDNFIYKKDYKKEYKFFKRDVLEKAIKEINKKTEYIIHIDDYRENGGIRTPIKYIQFIVTKKKNAPQKYKNAKYDNIAYYYACKLYWKKHNTSDPIAHIEKYSKKIEEAFKNYEFIYDIKSEKDIENLKIEAAKNKEAIMKIKKYMEVSPILSTYAFDEKYLVVLNTLKRDSKEKYLRLGNNAIECLEQLEKKHASIMENLNKKIQEKDEISSFMPFEFQDDIQDDIQDKFIKINSKNLSKYEDKIKIALKCLFFLSFNAILILSSYLSKSTVRIYLNMRIKSK